MKEELDGESSAHPEPNAAEPRNVIVCCDGTGNEFSTDRSNVLRLWRSLDKNANQLAYYDPATASAPREEACIGRAPPVASRASTED